MGRAGGPPRGYLWGPGGASRPLEHLPFARGRYSPYSGPSLGWLVLS